MLRKFISQPRPGSEILFPIMMSTMITVMPRANNGSSTKIGVIWQKSDFLAKNWNFGPKKRHSLFAPNHVLATTEKSCSKKKGPFAQIIKGENGIFVLFGPGLAGSFGWWLWRAGCISQDTYLLYCSVNILIFFRRESVYGCKRNHFLQMSWDTSHTTSFDI